LLAVSLSGQQKHDEQPTSCVKACKIACDDFLLQTVSREMALLDRSLCNAAEALSLVTVVSPGQE